MRAQHSTILDPIRNRMLVFGGFDATTDAGGNALFHNDVWQVPLSGTPTCTLLQTAGTAPNLGSGFYNSPALVYDSARDRILVLNRPSNGPNACLCPLADGDADVESLDVRPCQHPGSRLRGRGRSGRRAQRHPRVVVVPQSGWHAHLDRNPDHGRLPDLHERWDVGRLHFRQQPALSSTTGLALSARRGPFPLLRPRLGCVSARPAARSHPRPAQGSAQLTIPLPTEPFYSAAAASTKSGSFPLPWAASGGKSCPRLRDQPVDRVVRLFTTPR